MKQLLVFVRKEFYHVFRDRRTLLILFGLPVTQILLFGYALTSEVKNAAISVVDQSKDPATQAITEKVRASTHFNLAYADQTVQQLETRFRRNEIKCALVFPEGFAEALTHTGKARVQILTDGSDPNTATILTNYLSAILTDYIGQQQAGIPYRIDVQTRMLYNPEMNGSMNFIPGVMALIFMIVCTTLTSVSIVREKETGTMEILLVSPFRPVLVLIAKAIPYLALSVINFLLILFLGVVVLDMPLRGNFFLLFGESALFIITCLSLGLMISTIASTQQTAMLISMMGMMLPTILFTGFLFPLENMPRPLQIISNAIPSRWYYLIVKSVMLKGLGFGYVWKETLILAGMATALLLISLKRFTVRLG